MRPALGEAIRHAYRAAKLKQSDLALALGVHQTMVSQWVVGRVEPSLEQVRSIERICRVEPGTILCRAGLVSAEAALDHVKRVLDARQVVPDLRRDDVRQIWHSALPEDTRRQLVAELQGDEGFGEAVAG